MKKRILITSLLLMAMFPLKGASQPNALVDSYVTIAKTWEGMFGRLRAQSNITVVVVAYEHLYEVKNVIRIKANGPFLVLTNKVKGNSEFRTIVYAGNVLLIREGDRE